MYAVELTQYCPTLLLRAVEPAETSALVRLLRDSKARSCSDNALLNPILERDRFQVCDGSKKGNEGESQGRLENKSSRESNRFQEIPNYLYLSRVPGFRHGLATLWKICARFGPGTHCGLMISIRLKLLVHLYEEK
jgi:hypothetical protein